MQGTITWCRTLDRELNTTLTLLLAGLTDRATANRMDVSERTVQRRVRELMADATAVNRMQLGHHAALAGFAEQAWKTRDGPGYLETHDGTIPDAEGLRLLRLLLDDVPPERSLGLSPRSVERRVSELMALAGARSRAQLGWLATLLGWL